MGYLQKKHWARENQEQAHLFTCRATQNLLEQGITIDDIAIILAMPAEQQASFQQHLQSQSDLRRQHDSSINNEGEPKC